MHAPSVRAYRGALPLPAPARQPADALGAFLGVRRAVRAPARVPKPAFELAYCVGDRRRGAYFEATVPVTLARVRVSVARCVAELPYVEHDGGELTPVLAALFHAARHLVAAYLAAGGQPSPRRQHLETWQEGFERVEAAQAAAKAADHAQRVARGKRIAENARRKRGPGFVIPESTYADAVAHREADRAARATRARAVPTLPPELEEVCA